MLISVLYVLLGFVSVLMGLAILLQEPKQAGLSGAFGLGGDNQMLGTSPASGIAKLTRLLAVVFFALCLGVGILAKEEGSSSILEDDPANPAVTTGETAGADVGDALGGDMAGEGGAVIEVVDPVATENTDAAATSTEGEAAPTETTGEADAAADDAAGTATETETTPAEGSTPAGGAGQR
ncbi:MAG: preprotein translocase subunit SecG [Planctomycetota bacterium]